MRSITVIIDNNGIGCCHFIENDELRLRNSEAYDMTLRPRIGILQLDDIVTCCQVEIALDGLVTGTIRLGLESIQFVFIHVKNRDLEGLTVRAVYIHCEEERTGISNFHIPFCPLANRVRVTDCIEPQVTIGHMCFFAQHKICECAGSRQRSTCTVLIRDNNTCDLYVRVFTGIAYFDYILTCIQNNIAQVDCFVTGVILGSTCFVQRVDRSCVFVLKDLNAYEVTVVARNVYCYVVVAIIGAIHIPFGPTGQCFALRVYDLTALNAPIVRNDSVSVCQKISRSVLRQIYGSTTCICESNTEQFSVSYGIANSHHIVSCLQSYVSYLNRIQCFVVSVFDFSFRNANWRRTTFFEELYCVVMSKLVLDINGHIVRTCICQSNIPFSPASFGNI